MAAGPQDDFRPVGNSDFDADILVVQSLVRAHQDDEDFLAQNAVHFYYISQLFNYWDLTKKYIRSSEFISDLAKLPGYGRSQPYFGLEDLPRFQRLLLDVIDDLNQEFDETQKLNLDGIKYAFGFIANLACGADPTDATWIRKISNPDLRARCYPLPNLVGSFGFSTFLYAYFEGIYLIGVPIRLTYYDGRWDCPAIFMDHDYIHTEDMQYNRDVIYAKRLYYTILNDPDLSDLQKQCHLLMMWIPIHEESGLKYVSLHHAIRDAEITYNKLKQLAPDLVVGFRRFSDFTFSQVNLATLRTEAEKQRVAQQKYDPGADSWDKLFRTLDEQLAAPTDKLFFILAAWYHRYYVEQVVPAWGLTVAEFET